MLILVFQRKSFPQILRHQYWNFKNNSNWHSNTVTFLLSVPLYHPLNLSLSFPLVFHYIVCSTFLLNYYLVYLCFWNTSLYSYYTIVLCVWVCFCITFSLSSHTTLCYVCMVDCLCFTLSLSSSLSLYYTLYLGMSLCP